MIQRERQREREREGQRRTERHRYIHTYIHTDIETYMQLQCLLGTYFIALSSRTTGLVLYIYNHGDYKANC